MHTLSDILEEKTHKSRVPKELGKSIWTPVAKIEESAKLLRISFVRPDFHVGANSWPVLWKCAIRDLGSTRVLCTVTQTVQAEVAQQRQ